MNTAMYRKEMRALAKRRKSHFPRLLELYELHHRRPRESAVVGYTAENGMLEIIELIDTGFLKAEAFDVKQSFGDYRAVYYNGAYPLTEKGLAFISEMRKSQFKKSFIIALVTLLLTSFAIIAITC